jgi:type II secretory pathway component PulJ
MLMPAKATQNVNSKSHGNCLARQQGVNLIELMIGITVGLVILAGVVTVVAQTSFSGLENVRSVQMNQQSRGAVDLMRRDLQRAGYVQAWTPGSATVIAGLDMDAVDIFGTITLGGTCAGAVCTCILYSYDRDEDGDQGVGTSGTAGTGQDDDNFELYGFRLNGGAIEMRTAGDTHACNSGTWEDITDASVNVTALTFEQDTSDSTIYAISDEDGDGVCDVGEVCYAQRKININVDAQLTSDATITFEVREEIKVKNGHYYTS